MQREGEVEFRALGHLRTQTDYTRGTKDSDVLETASLDETTQKRLAALAGENTAIHKRHRLYIDIVRSGVPFLPHEPVFHNQSTLNASTSARSSARFVERGRAEAPLRA